MSLESQIADLVSATNALLTNFNAKKSSIDTAVANAIAAIPVNKKVLYVHQLNGLDTNDGSAANPLKSIDKAIAMTPVGGVLSVRLLSDYNMSPSVLSLEGVRLEMRTDTIAQRRVLRPCYFKSGDGTTTLLSCFSANLGAEFSLRDITMELPSAAGQAPAPTGGDNALFKANATSPVTTLPLKFINCEVVDQPGATAALTSSSTSGMVLAVTGTTFPSAFAGRYVAGIASGTAVSSVNHLVSNLSTL